jgi:two-component system, OmpR family, response regulator QseB
MKMPDILESPSITLHPGLHTCTVRGKLVPLTANQFKLLYYLMHKPHWVRSRRDIIDDTQGTDYPVTLPSVDVAIHHLRNRIGKGLIETVTGVGFRFAEDVVRRECG